MLQVMMGFVMVMKRFGVQGGRRRAAHLDNKQEVKYRHDCTHNVHTIQMNMYLNNHIVPAIAETPPYP